MNRQEAYEASLEYFDGDELAANVFVDKYAMQDNEGNHVEFTPRDMHHRLAKEFARIEAKYPGALSEQEIFDLLDNFRYIVPQGSPMSAIGNDYQIQSLSNCFVIPSPYDSYGGILRSDQHLAQLMKRRAGVGLDISTIRPKGMVTKNAAKTTDGIAVFMERFSNTCREVAQNGRRGAELMSISVHHPEVLTFAKIKQDLTKVTGANISIKLTGEFMNAVKEGTDYEVRWPVDSDDPVVVDRLSAAEVWDTIITQARDNAEPGLFFWDNVEKWTPSDAYPKYKAVSTNPCVAGDTLIAVADGRGAVSIQELAEEGRDVPVYSTDPETGEVSIQWGRNPRITGYNKKLLRVTLDDGSHYDVTPNHRFVMRDGTAKEARNLIPKDSIAPFHKKKKALSTSGNLYYEVGTNINAIYQEGGRIMEHKLISQFHDPEAWDAPDHKPKLNGGLVVHHKDFDGLNNSPENLQVMTWRDHQMLHAKLADGTGDKNPRWMEVTNEEIRAAAIELTKSLGYRFSHNDWVNFADKKGLPKAFSDHRAQELGSVSELAKKAAIELGLEGGDIDTRVQRTILKLTNQGYQTSIVDGQVFVSRTCEQCSSSFLVHHIRRENSFCSSKCASTHLASREDSKASQNAAINEHWAKRAEKLRENQVRIYSDLKFELERDPEMKEWEQACKAEGVSYRVGQKLKYGFKTYGEIKKAAEAYNHKVVSVEELDGEHTVYNITVDKNHTFGVVNHTENGYTGIYTHNCGEIVLNAGDSCRLLVLNTISYVDNPYTPEASFDYDKFMEHAEIGQRLMDDIIDLELEKIDTIIEKIKSDPEPLYVKQTELDLWLDIRDTCERGRRTGLGVTAIGDTVAAAGHKYGSEDSIGFVESVYRALAIGAYRATVKMARDRGPFPEYDFELEKDHPFINRIMDQDDQLRADWEKYGRRNIALTTTAPTGSVSILTQTTSGIEPAFMLSYTRRRKVMDDSTEVHFVDDLGDKWEEFIVYHHGVKKWMEITGETDIGKSPYVGATANEINWVNRVKIQGAAQRWICHSISSTINLPEDVTVERVKEIYEAGWEEGLKGVTVYREGSRSGVLVDTKKLENNDTIQIHSAPKRPAELPCDVYHMTVQGEKWVMFVGLMDGKPYELMGGLSQYVTLPKRVKEGKIVKFKNGSPQARYDFHYDYLKKVDSEASEDGTVTVTYVEDPDSEVVVKDINHSFENATESAFTRTISLALRHGASPQYVVEQLQKGSEKDDDLFAFSKAASRVLKNYIEDNVVANGACKDCGSENVFYQEGCLTCADCGSSKCG